MSSKVKYKGITIAEMNTNTSKTLKTSGLYCEADIVVENTQDGGITPSGQIEITENGTFDVTNYASALVDVQGGSGKSYLLREDNITVISSPALTQVATGCESVELTSANFSATDENGNSYIPIAPEGANFVLIEATSSAIAVRDLMVAKGYSRDMYNKYVDILAPGTNEAKTQWAVRNHQSNGLYFCNGSTLNINGHNAPANTNDFTSFFAMKEAIFGTYDHDTIAGYTANNTSGGLYINDVGHLVAILMKRSSGTGGLFNILKPKVSYTLRWFHFDKPPICGFFTEPYEEE